MAAKNSGLAEEGMGGSLLWLGILLLIATVVRLISLDNQLWFDEIDTLVNSVRRPLWEIFTTYPSQNQHTLYSILAWFSVKAFGESPWALRLPAMLFGVASVPALYALGCLVTSRREALFAAGLMAASYHAVWFSQNARGYTGMLFLTLVTTLCFVRGVRQSSWGIWMAYAVAMALGLYTHLTMGFVSAGHAFVFAALLLRRRAQEKRWPGFAAHGMGGFLAAGILTLGLYAPVLPEIYARTIVQAAPQAVEWEWKSPWWALQEALRGLSFGSGIGLVVVAVAGALVISGVASYWRREGYVVGLMLLPGIVTAAAMLAVGHNLWPRFFFFAVGFAFLLVIRGVVVLSGVAAGWMRLGSAKGQLLAAVACGVILLGSAATVPAAYRFPKQDFLGAMQFVDEQRGANDAVVTVGLTAFPYREFYGRDWPAVENPEELHALRVQGRSVWILYAFPIHLEAQHAGLWHLIQSEFKTVHVFPGTLGGGEIYVARWE